MSEISRDKEGRLYSSTNTDEEPNMLTKRDLLRSAALAGSDNCDNDACPGETPGEGGMA